MKPIIVVPNPTNKYKIALLIKETCTGLKEIRKYYLDPLEKLGIAAENVIVFGAAYSVVNKAPVQLIKAYLNGALPIMKGFGVETILCADPNYFKRLAKKTKSEVHHGYIFPCAIKEYEDINIILSTNYAALFYNPTLQEKLDLSLRTLKDYLEGFHVELGTDIIHYKYYPDDVSDVTTALLRLYQYDTLTCDIETFSLQFWKASIGTMSLAWDKHSGIAFRVDLNRNWKDALIIRKALIDFFSTYTGKIIYHNANYDIKVLIYELFMEHALDRKGLIYGIRTLCKNIDDTKLISYLAINTTSEISLKLKHLAFEYTGNYAQEDIKDITKIPVPELLEYNLIDGLATWFVHDKYYPIMVIDQQEEIYNEIFLPSIEVILSMELTGMPISMDKVYEAKQQLETDVASHSAMLRASPLIQDLEKRLRTEARDKANAKLKTKVKPLSDFDDLFFNPGSSKQLQELLYKDFGFEVIDKTPKGAPATGGDTLKKMLAKLKADYNLTDEEIENVTYAP